MAHTTVRVKKSTRALIRTLASSEGRSMQAVIEDAIEQYRRMRFIERVNTAYAWSAGNDGLLAAEQDGTLLDGLPRGEIWTEDGDVER